MQQAQSEFDNARPARHEFEARAQATRLGIRLQHRVRHARRLGLDHELGHRRVAIPEGRGVEHEEPRTRIPRGASAGLREAQQRAFGHLARRPVQAVAQRGRRAGIQPVARAPSGHDVVVNLVLRRYLEQLHLSGAPVVKRLDPEVRTAMVSGFQVQVAREVAATLQQTEAARAGLLKTADLQFARVAQRPPDLLALPGTHQQPIGVMHAWTKVGHAGPITGTEVDTCWCPVRSRCARSRAAETTAP
jgi:hypothetical protein